MAILGAIMVPHPPLIVPAVGKGEERIIEETTKAYHEAARFVAELEPETIVLSTPHSILYSDYFHISPGIGATGSLSQFRAPQEKYNVDYDTAFVEALVSAADLQGFPAGTLGERDRNLDHGTMVPLHFINQYYKDYQLVRIGLSGLPLADHFRIGKMIAKRAEELNRRVVYVASGDLSHKLQASGPYGFDPHGPVYDERIMDVMGKGDFIRLLDFEEDLCDKASECGHRSFCMMAGALEGLRVEVKELSHQDVTGVGYGVCIYRVTGKDENRRFLRQWEERQEEMLRKRKEKEDAYVRLARKSLESYIVSGEKIRVPEDVPEEMLRTRAGAFVSLHKEGKLRGCIGTIGPVQENVAEEIIENAISASTRDPRFDAVTIDELSSLEYSVDVLGETEPVDSEDMLDVKRYGVIVTKGMKRGLLLPNLDGVDTVAEQLAIAKRKAGLSPDEKGCRLERFEVVRHY
ncbi:MAG: AmmeMemoRadiSam system protein A [Lachnospiraceae bacterium]|nr:AmmeMemoRadiSam system protein A [Lachnospiraceae bacterium]